MLAIVIAVAPPVAAQAQPVPPAAAAMPDDDLVEQVVEQQRDGHVWQAQAVLRRLAESGHVVAMERLALMHWYGGQLYPGQPWSRAEAAEWFARAAAQGSELGRHMLPVARRALAGAAR